MRRVFVLTSVLALAVLSGILGAVLLPTAGTRLAVRKLVPLAAEHGVVLSVAPGWKARLRWPASIVWEGLALQARNTRPQLLPPPAEASLTIERATAELGVFAGRTLAISLDGLTAVARTDAAQASNRGIPREITIEGRSLTFAAPADLPRPTRMSAGFRDLARELQRWRGRDGATFPCVSRARRAFLLEGAPASAAIRVRREGSGSILTIAEEDVIALSSRFDLRDPLTQDEVTILARHPLRIPRMIGIRNEAERKAREEQQRDPSFPLDAYRHILWSFLLTKAWGEQFAALLTDAHERGITDNTQAERLMDLANNALGRWYAAVGVEERSLPARVKLDQRVIRSAGNAGRARLSGDPGGDSR